MPQRSIWLHDGVARLKRLRVIASEHHDHDLWVVPLDLNWQLGDPVEVSEVRKTSVAYRGLDQPYGRRVADLICKTDTEVFSDRISDTQFIKDIARAEQEELRNSRGSRKEPVSDEDDPEEDREVDRRK